MEITGKIIEIGNTEQVTESLKKRVVLLEYAENPQYPEYLQFEGIQDKCSLLDNKRVGDTLTVHFNLKGRAWTDKNRKRSYFNTLQYWKLT